MRRVVAFFILLAVAVPALWAQTAAFPGAEGHARYTTTGGRGGKVYHVTKLTDDGSKGTLRYAVRKSGVRTVVFDVSGTIELASDLVISSGDITIAGQTAPGDGICLKNYSLKIDADNVIIRFIRCRLGEMAADARDAFEGQGHKNIIVDHCSMSFSTDECASFYDNTHFTMQWCFIAESLKASVHAKGNHGYGGIWGGKDASFHHNILAHHDSRNPRMCGSRYSNRADLENVDFRNNVIYNWGNTNSGYAAEGGTYNFVNNYYKPGPATKKSIVARIFQPTEYDAGDVTTHTAATAFDKVVAYAGASLSRDAQDTRIADEIRNGSYTYAGSSTGQYGILDKTSDVGGWSELLSTEAPLDSDEDGIPDAWETLNNLDPDDDSDAALLWHDDTGYTALEVYLHSLVDNIVRACQSDGTGLTEVYPRYTDAAVDATRHTPVQLSYAAGRYTIGGFDGEATLYIYTLSGALKSVIKGCDTITFTLDRPAIIRLATSQTVVVRKLLPC